MRLTRTGAVAAALVAAGYCASAGIAHADPNPPPIPKTSIDADGTYPVGTDIAPGTYVSGGPAGDSACYWKRVKGSDIVDNALSKKTQVVHIDPTDTTFTTSHCQPWHLTDCAQGCGPAEQSPLGMLGDLKDFLGPHLGSIVTGGGP